MKRVFSLLLIIPVLFIAFPFFVPVSAAETSGSYFNVLDYTGINGSTSNFLMFTGSAEMNFDLRSTYGFFTAYSVEFTYSYSGSTPSLSALTLDGTPSASIRSDYIGDGIFRARAKFNGTPGSSFDVVLSSSGKCSINVLSFNVYLCSTEYVPLDGYIYFGGGTFYFSGGSYPYTKVPSSNGLLEISIDSWRNYDSLAFYMYLKSDAVSSISAYIRDNTNLDVIPLDVSFGSAILPSDSSVKNLAFSVDLTSIDRVSANDSTIVIEIYYSSTSNDAFRLDSAHGVVFSDPPDPVTKWNQILFFNLQQWFSSLNNTVHNGFEEVKALMDKYFGSSSLEQSSSELDSALDGIEESIIGQNDVFNLLFPSDQTNILANSFGDIIDLSQTTISLWGNVLNFAWKPLGDLSNTYLLVIGAFMFVGILLFRR